MHFSQKTEKPVPIFQGDTKNAIYMLVLEDPLMLEFCEIACKSLISGSNFFYKLLL